MSQITTQANQQIGAEIQQLSTANGASTQAVIDSDLSGIGSQASVAMGQRLNDEVNQKLASEINVPALPNDSQAPSPVPSGSGGSGPTMSWAQTPSMNEVTYLNPAGDSAQTLPAIERPYYVDKGYYEQVHDTAVEGFSDPSNTLLQRAGYLVLGAAEEPANLVAGWIRGIENIYSDASVAGQSAAAAVLSNNSNDMLSYTSQSLMAGGQAIANSFGLAGLLSGGITGSVASDSSAVANPAVPNTTAVDTSLASGADASAIRARVLSNIADSQAARASSNFGQFSQVEGQLQEALGIWPPNNGGYAPIYNTTLDVGTQLDRFGFPGGTYLSPLGDSFGGRALPSSYLTTKPYFQYEVIQPIPGVTQAKALPWFGQPGMGTQFQVPNSVQWYLNNGYLKVIHP